MFSRFLRRVRVPTDTGRPAQFRYRHGRPTLEELESRTVPTTFTWQGVTGGSWSVGTNWDQGTVPATGADVVINNGTTPDFNTTIEINTLSIGSASGLSIAGGTLTVDADSTWNGTVTIASGTVNVGDAATDVVNAAAVNLSGTLGGSGNLLITSALNWTANGTMTGGGTTTVAATATLTMNANNTSLDTRTLINDGTANLSGAGSLAFVNGAVFDNNGTFTATGGLSYAIGPGGGTFRNDGSFTRIGTGSTTTFGTVFTNNGTVSLVSGTLNLAGGGTSTAAAFTVGNGSNLAFGNNYTVDGASSISGDGSVQFAAGTVTVNGSYAITGETTVSNTTNFNTPTTFPTLNLSGIVGGSGNLLITSALNWTANGTMTGAGTTTVAATATLTMTANNTLLDARTLINDGTANLSGAGSMAFVNGAVFDNNGTFTTTGSFGYAIGPGGGTFRNDGSFTRTGTGSTTAFGTAFTNNGTVSVASGTLNLAGGGTSTAAAFTISSGSNLLFNNNYTLDGASSISGDGSVQFAAGTVTVNGSYAITGETTVSNTTNFNTPTTFPTLNLSGIVGGSGNLLITSALNWTANGTMTGAGTTTVAATATLTMTANNTLLDARTLVNDGTAALSGAGSLGFVNGAVFDNNGAFTTTGGFAYSNGPGGGAFINDGSFTRIGSGSTTAFGAAFTNNGTVEVQSGTQTFTGTVTNFSGGTLTGGSWIVHSGATLNTPAAIATNRANVVLDGANSNFPQFDNIAVNDTAGIFTIQNGRNFTTAAGFTNAGSVTVEAGSTLATAAGTDYTQTGGSTTLTAATSKLDPGATADIQAGSLRGAGVVLGDVRNAGAVDPGTSPGMLTIDGDYTQTGALNIEIGGLAPGTQFDQLAATGDINLGGALNVSLAGGFVPLTGNSFRIVNATGAGTTGGTFAGLAEGAILDVGIFKFHVTYAGGTGDDVVLTAINLAPTLDAIPDPGPVPEDSGTQTVNLSGIAAGGADTQTLTVAAVSSNPGLIPNPTVIYSSPDATGSLHYTPAVGQSGTAVITVTITDDGGTANGGVDTTTRTFTVTVVAPVATTTTITASSPSPSTFGEEVTFTITVAPAAGTVLPTGTLTLMEGNTVLGTSTNLVAIGGVATATFTTTATQLGGGSHTVTAVYAGTDIFFGSTSPGFTHTVLPAATTTTITQATPATSVLGQAVTFTATVAPGVGGILPGGSVTFMDGAVVLGTSNLANIGGIATATFASAGQLAVGAHTITAVYGGDADFAASTSGGFTHTVEPPRVAKVGIVRDLPRRWRLDAFNDGVFNPAQDRQFFNLGRGQTIVGDWDGDGNDDLGLFRTDTGTFKLFVNGTLFRTVTRLDGKTGGKPLVGNWDGLPGDEVGLYRTATGVFTLDIDGDGVAHDPDDRVGGRLDGRTGGKPLVGNWDGAGGDEVGLYHADTGVFTLDIDGDLVSRDADDTVITRLAGKVGGQALVGDWDGDGHDNIGLFFTLSGKWLLDTDSNPSAAERTYTRLDGQVGGTAVVGDFDGDGDTDCGLFRPSSGKWIIDLNDNGVFDVGVDLLFRKVDGATGGLPLVGKWELP